MQKLLLPLIAIMIMACSSPVQNAPSGSSKQLDITSDGGGVFIKQGILPMVGITGDSRAWMNTNWAQLKNFVINVSLPGSTTKFPLNHIDELAHSGVKYVFIFTGINDAWAGNADFQSDLTRMSIACKLNGVQFVILDQTLCQAKLVAPFTNYQFLLSMCNQIMQNIPYAIYLPVSYNDDDFIDHVHLSSTGFQKVAEAIHAKFTDVLIE